MNVTSKLVRGLFLALAILLSAPFAGVGGALVGVQTVQAQGQDPLIASVLFEGNRRFSDAQLLAMVDVSTRGTYNAGRVQVDVESIRIAYDQAGFNNVQVSANAQAMDNGRVLVTFVVNEGERAGIKAINFTGNNAINGGTLKGVMNTKESGFLSWLLRDDTYDEQKLAVDRELIRIYYANSGFPDAQVTSVSEYDPGQNAYFINFTIIEGERYTYGPVGIESSITGLNADGLRGLVQTREGARYSLRDINQSAEDIAYEATLQGYSFADVRPRVERDPVNHIFGITYLVDEGPRVYVERINITGNEKTRDFVIRRELDFAEGDPFNRNLVTRGKSAIEALDYFEQVNVTAEPGSAPDRAIINIAVVEKSTGDYGVTVGYSTSDGFLGEVSLTERNFLGRGQYLRVAVGATESGRTFDFSFTEPRFMGLKVSAGVDIYHRINDESATNFYGSTTTGGVLRFGLPITRDLTATLFTGLETKSIVDNETPYDHDDDPATPKILPDGMSSIVNDGEVYNKATVGYTLTFDALDDRRNPTQGLFATFTQSYIGWDFNYLKSEVRARYFMPLIEDTGIIASVRGSAGIIHDFSGEGVSALESFGITPQIIRGFQNRRVGPRLESGEALGTTMYAAASAEIEFPIPVLPESYGLSGAVWADVAYIDGVPATGTGVLDPLSVDQNLKSSIGVSLLWDSPFGPLRGDFAHVLSKATEDQSQLFQFTLSTLL